MSVDVIQMEPFRLVEMAAKLACGGDDTLHVEHRRFALSNQPSGRMSDSGDIAILHGVDDAISLHLPRQRAVLLAKGHLCCPGAKSRPHNRACAALRPFSA